MKLLRELQRTGVLHLIAGLVLAQWMPFLGGIVLLAGFFRLAISVGWDVTILLMRIFRR